TVGNCAGEPIAESLEIDIDVTAFAAANCANTPAIQNFTVCNPVNDEAPISLVAGAFPPGSRFYAEYPVTETTTEYTSANPFPVQAGNNTFYSLAPGDNGCYFEFNIQVTSIEAPVAPAQQSFCASDLPTTSDLAATGSNIKWYANASGGSPLP